MRVKTHDGAELCVETFGDAGDPALLLIAGGASSMDRWEEPFCERLAAAGRYVIRYDHRDTGGSTTYPPGEPGYGGEQLTTDALAVLDTLGIARAHLVGLSMGGGIAQEIAARHPDRVLSIALLCTSPALADELELPAPDPALFADEPPAPDWSDRAAAIDYLLAVERLYAGRRGIDEQELRPLIEYVVDRSIDPASAFNHFQAAGDDAPPPVRLADLRVPALVVHGTDDPLFALPHGEALARGIPGARLLVVDGLGHELPRWAWDEVLPALVELSARP